MITLPCLYAVLRPDCLEAMQRGTPDLQLLTCQLGKGNQQKLLTWHIQPEEGAWKSKRTEEAIRDPEEDLRRQSERA